MTRLSPDAVLASAVDPARAAVLEIAPADHVGEHRAVAHDGAVATHTFDCLAPGYRGWSWAVTVAVVPDGDRATVSEVVLLPGSDALLAPEWVPWTERVRPGDLGPGDLYPTAPQDPRLEPGYGGADALEAADETATADLLAAPLRPEQWELGLGRETVLSAYGRGVAADRWYDGDFGPGAPMARLAPAPCRTCGFLLPVGGLVGQAFGVCANEFGADGRVVALGYGCGAHSSVREVEGTGVPVTDVAVDEYDLETVDLRVVGEGAASEEVPVAVAEIAAEGSEVEVIAEAPDAEVSDEELARELSAALNEPVVGLREPDEDGDLEEEPEEGEDEGDLVDEEDEYADEDEFDEEDEYADEDVAQLELDDVEDIEPDERL